MFIQMSLPVANFMHYPGVALAQQLGHFLAAFVWYNCLFILLCEDIIKWYFNLDVQRAEGKQQLRLKKNSIFCSNTSYVCCCLFQWILAHCCVIKKEISYFPSIILVTVCKVMILKLEDPDAACCGRMPPLEGAGGSGASRCGELACRPTVPALLPRAAGSAGGWAL